MSLSVAPASQDAPALLRWRRDQMRRRQRARLGFWRSLGRSNRLFPRKLVVTREGKWIIAIALLLGAGAVNTGNNLLYLVLSLTFSVIAVSGILSERNLQHVSVRRRYPREVDVGAVTPLRIEVKNAKQRPALHIEVGEVSDDEDVHVRNGYLLHLAPQEGGHAFAQVRVLRRGPVQTAALQVVTGYPYGFARKARLWIEPAWFVALPNVARVTLPWQGAPARDGELQQPRLGHGDEFRGLRDARPGDPPRDVHWKVSARRDRLIVREWEAQATRAAVVRFAHVAPTPPGQRPRGSTGAPEVDPRTLDAACATVAGLCAALLADGLAVGLQTLQGAVAPVAEPTAAGRAGADGTDQLQRIRRLLADLLPADGRPPAYWPLDDDRWLAACRAADAASRTVGDGLPLRWTSLPLQVACERFDVAFEGRADVATDGEPDVRVRLDGSGAIVAIDRTQRPLGRAA
ncbi:MAG: DUF58 domain-containing protein [Myxococcales bacterium]|nr:DUF58 domain-containing protein [Myxococcales bacterium]